MSRRLLSCLPLALALASCAVAPLEVLPPAAMAGTPAWPVTGRQGWLPGRELRFAGYATRALSQHGKTRSQECPQGCTRIDLGLYQRKFEESRSQSRQAVRFTLVGPDGAESDIQFERQLDEERRRWITRWFGLPTDAGADRVRRFSLVGTVQPMIDGQPAWRLALADGEAGRLEGWIDDERGRRLTLTPLNALRGPHGPVVLPLPHGGALGYVFEHEGRPLFAVALEGPGTVWLHPAVDAKERLALASLAAILLIQPARAP